MKSFILFVFLLVLVMMSVSSQSVHSLYFMGEMSQRHQYNPAFVPKYGYISLPILGNIQVGGSSNLGVSNFIYEKANKLVTFMHPSVSDDEFISSIKPENYMNQDLKIDLLSCGLFTKKNEFWSFDLSIKENLYVNLPGDLLRFAKLGMNSSTNHFDLKNIKYENTYWLESALGYSFEVNDHVRVGGKIKFLAGLSSATINYSQFDVDLNQDNWGVLAKGESLLASKMVSLDKDSAGYFSFKDYLWNGYNREPAGYGAAFDLGITYNPTPNVTLAASLENLGFLHWKQSSVQHGMAESTVTFNGFTLDAQLYSTWSSQFWILKQQAKDFARFKETAVSCGYNQWLPTTIRASAEYTICRNSRKQEVRVGMLSNIYYNQNYPNGEFVTALTFKPADWLSITTTYAILQKNPNRFGLALNASPRWINFFLASDFLAIKLNRQLLPISQFVFDLQTGISIPLCKNRKPYRYVYNDRL